MFVEFPVNFFEFPLNFCTQGYSSRFDEVHRRNESLEDRINRKFRKCHFSRIVNISRRLSKRLPDPRGHPRKPPRNLLIRPPEHVQFGYCIFFYIHLICNIKGLKTIKYFFKSQDQDQWRQNTIGGGRKIYQGENYPGSGGNSRKTQKSTILKKMI